MLTSARRTNPGISRKNNCTSGREFVRLIIKNRSLDPQFSVLLAPAFHRECFSSAVAPNRNVLRVALIYHRSSFQRTAIALDRKA